MAAMKFPERLAESLERDCRVRVYHVSTKPSPTIPIFSPGPGQQEQVTSCESHLLLVSTSEEANRPEGIFIFAIEVLIFTTPTFTNVFVSKADSSGFASKLGLSPSASKSSTRIIVEIFLDYLLQARLDEGKQIVVSLFARSQNQYLFPGSIENPGKRVLDDRQLIKWWARVLDSLWRPYTAKVELSHEISAYVVVPGCDTSETRSFFPVSSTSEKGDAQKWRSKYPVDLLVDDPSLPPRCLIPRLPDDPKARFLTDLDGDYIGEDGHWRSVKSLNQFWETMSYRQECAAGRLVGFIWVVFDRKMKTAKTDPSDMGVTSSFRSEASSQSALPTPAESQHHSTYDAGNILQDDLQSLPTLHLPPPSSPILAEQRAGLEPFMVDEKASDILNENPIGGDPELPKPSQSEDDPSQAFAWPDTTRGQIILTSDEYDALVEFLLDLDFAGEETAFENTLMFINEAKKTAQASDFGIPVIGKKVLETPPAQTVSSQNALQPTMLMGVRKKRKPESTNGTSSIPESTLPGVSSLPLSMVRKKPKLENP